MKVRMTNYQTNCYLKGSQLNPIILKKTLICFYLLEIKTVWFFLLLKSTDNLRQIFKHTVYFIGSLLICYFPVLAVLKVVLHIQVYDI